MSIIKHSPKEGLHYGDKACIEGLVKLYIDSQKENFKLQRELRGMEVQRNDAEDFEFELHAAGECNDPCWTPANVCGYRNHNQYGIEDFATLHENACELCVRVAERCGITV